MKALKLPYVEKPCGYSKFYHENVPVPKQWAAKSVNLVYFNEHPTGGHFAVSTFHFPTSLSFLVHSCSRGD